MTLSSERDRAIESALSQVRAIEAERGITHESLQDIRDVMIALGARTELFPVEDYPISDESGGEVFKVLSVDDDGRYELYIEVANKYVTTPPHNHTTWAVVVGIRGLELNKVYEGDGGDAGVAPLKIAREVRVEKNAGVALMPDEFHSIHMEEGVYNMHLHLYGRSFEQLKGRLMYDKTSRTYQSFDVSM